VHPAVCGWAVECWQQWEKSRTQPVGLAPLHSGAQGLRVFLWWSKIYLFTVLVRGPTCRPESCCTALRKEHFIMFRIVFWDVLPSSLMMEAVRTSETSVDNHFTRQYIPEDNSQHHTRRRENLKSQTFYKLVVIFRFLLSDVIYSSGKTERTRNLSFFTFSEEPS
jgi:hypothetical protein